MVAADNLDATTDDNVLDECLVCSDHKRDTICFPCAHVSCCYTCAPRIKKCLICRENVGNRIKVKYFYHILILSSYKNQSY